MFCCKGISAGGFMAVQYHVAFSSEVSGCGVFAGGPFYCARNALNNALTACTVAPIILDVSELVSEAQSFSSSGQIDSLSGLSGDKVFLFSGLIDTVVHQDVVRKAGEWYKTFNVSVTSVFHHLAEHCMPSLSYGNPCFELGSPYISKCDYDGAGQALQTLLAPQTLRPATSPVSSNIIEISQKKYFPSGSGVFGVAGMSDTAYAYIPTQCAQGKICQIHVAFHGCNQEAHKIGKVYVENAGYNGWAEANNIIVLYPQAKPDVLKNNPEGCFDWWGYTNSNYAFKTSLQMQTVRNMIQALKTPQGPMRA